MKKNILTGLVLFLAATVLFVSCRKEDEAAVNPIIKTLDISGITDSSAIGHGYVVQGAKSITEEGICFSSTEEIPTINSEKAVSTDKTAEIVGAMNNLAYKTKYYYRAYAIHAGGVEYGEVMNFISSIRLAIISVNDATAITGNSATSGGNVTDLGGGEVIAKGVCWTRDSLPTIENDTTIDGEGLGAFTSELKELWGGSTYNIRAYAINEAGVSYSEAKSFSTPNYTAIVTTDSVENIAKTSFTIYGTVVHDGGPDITERGFCWATTENPTIADNKIADAKNTTGVMNADITGLTAGTKYYVRAYATNSEGTAYSDDYVVETIGEFFIVGSINGWNNHGQYMSYIGNGVFTAYQYLTSTDAFKFFPVRDSWDNGWGAEGGDCGTDGTAVLGGGNICTNNQSDFSTDGFYEIKFDATNKTVALTLITQMGVIGDAQGSWNDDTFLTYVEGTKTWEGQVTFEATGEYKFRANGAWAIAFGTSLANLTNQDGAPNLTTPGAGTYDVVLSLSGPDNFNATVTPAK